MSETPSSMHSFDRLDAIAFASMGTSMLGLIAQLFVGMQEGARSPGALAITVASFVVGYALVEARRLRSTGPAELAILVSASLVAGAAAVRVQDSSSLALYAVIPGLVLLAGSLYGKAYVAALDSDEFEEPPERKSLVSRSIDFWLIGGFSIFAWGFAHGHDALLTSDWGSPLGFHLANYAALSATLSLVCNYPHFMASYKMAYGQGLGFVKKGWFQLVLVPAALLGLIFWAYSTQDVPMEEAAAFASVSEWLDGVGIDNHIGEQLTVGNELLQYLFLLMYITLGWHYSKQTFGVMMVMANYDGYRMDGRQRNVLKYGLHTIWFANFAWLNRALQWNQDYSGLWVSNWGFSEFAFWIAQGLAAFACLAIILVVFVPNYRKSGAIPSANMLVPWLTFMLWYLPGLMQPEFFFLLVPFFHSLQYLGFVYKVERGRLTEKDRRSLHTRGAVAVIALLAAGFFFFQLMPRALDARYQTQELYGVWFFWAASGAFINVHHYFIDNVLWRFKHSHVRKYLLA